MSMYTKHNLDAIEVFVVIHSVFLLKLISKSLNNIRAYKFTQILYTKGLYEDSNFAGHKVPTNFSADSNKRSRFMLVI